MTLPPRSKPVPPRLLKSGEMAALLGCSVDTLQRMRKAGKLKAGVYKSGGFLRFDAAAVLEQLREKQ